MNRLSRVIPALLMRMSMGAFAAASAFFTSSSTPARSARSQGQTTARSPSAAFSESSASILVPESTTRARCPCSAVAIAPPIPPDAPVTSAVLPVKSNMQCHLISSRCLSPQRTTLQARLQRFGESLYIGWRIQRHRLKLSVDALDHAREHLVAPQFHRHRRSELTKTRHRLAPTHARGQLLDEQAPDRIGLDRLSRSDV